MPKKHKRLLRVLSFIIMLLGVLPSTGCSKTEQVLPLERVSLSKHACNGGGGLSPHIPLGVNQQIKAPVLAGGAVRSGDFLISLYLICDPSLEADDPENLEYSWQEYSEVRYLGLASGWRIVGYNPDLEGLDTKESLTINGEVIQGMGGGPQIAVSYGTGFMHYGPINTENQIVARALEAGKPVEIVLTISTSKTLDAVRLQASFEETSDGYRLLSAEIGEVK